MRVQVVVLGAGYDTRAYRLPSLRHARTVFEVDHPDTQAAKHRALARALPELPAHVRFVATDFEQQSFESAIAEAGFRPDVVTVFTYVHRDVGAAELRAQHLGPAADGIHGHELYRVAVARVGA